MLKIFPIEKGFIFAVEDRSLGLQDNEMQVL